MSLIGVFHRYTYIFHGYSGISVVFRYFGDSCDPSVGAYVRMYIFSCCDSSLPVIMFPWRSKKNIYGKSPKISYTQVSDKMAYANSADPEQTAV